MEFKEFKIEDLFNVESSKKIFHANNVVIKNCPEKDFYPYVVRSAQNNGVVGYINEKKEYLNPKNTLSFAQDTFVVFYQNQDYFTGNKVKILTPKIKFNQNIGLFITSVFNALLKNYSWGVGSTTETIKNYKIQLPITSAGEIDFDYMEQYIEKIEKQYIEKIALMLKASGLDNYQLTEEEKMVLKEEKEKKEFKIEDLWVVDDWVYGKDKKWKTQFDRPVEGSLPVISGQTTNNGVKYYTTDNYSTDEVFEDCLTMTTRGESGRVFYHPGKFLLANNVLVMKMPKYSKNVMLYLGTVIEKVCRSTNYSVYPTKDSLKTKTIFLPVTPTEEIDFEYMEKYISAITKNKIKNVVLEINKKLELYKQTQN